MNKTQYDTLLEAFDLASNIEEGLCTHAQFIELRILLEKLVVELDPNNAHSS